MVEQVVDQAVHVVGLFVDDPEELEHLGRLRGPRCVQHGGRRTLDRDQRRPQFVAHDAQELGPLPLQLLQGCQVLQGDHHRLDRAVRRSGRRGVDQRRHAPAVWNRQGDLLGAHRFGAAQLPCHREFRKGDLGPPVAAATGDLVQQFLQRPIRKAQALDDSPRLAIDRHGLSGGSVEDDDAHRRGFDQGLQVGPGPPLGLVRACVDDGRRRLRREEDQNLLVGVRELRSALLVSEEKVADVRTPVAHRRALHRVHHHQLRREAEFPDIGGQVRHPQRLGQVAEVLEQPRSVRPLGHLRGDVRRQAGGDEVTGSSGVVNGDDQAVAGTGQRAGAVDDLP